jgi:hypothetical protein
MPTDKERREVARRLREMGEELGSSVLLWYHIAKILGVRTATDGKTACDMLADLIDPGELKTTCIAEVKIEGEKLDEAVNRAIAEYTGIDRDALLELADDLDRMGDGSMYDPCISDEYGIARRIREILGVKS